MKVSDYIVSFLALKWSHTIFSLSGGMISHLEDSIFMNPDTTLVSVKHEQAGAFAAEGYTRVSGKSAVAMGTSGPWATNMITGIASAYFDSIPVLYITGQVRTDELTPSTSWVRQTGFQETKIIPIVTPITKYAHHVADISELRYELEKAYHLMHEGRKWPAVLDIPMNIQRLDIDPKVLPSYYESDEYSERIRRKKDISQEQIWSIISDIQSAKKPIILLWGGIRLADASMKLRTFTDCTHIPVVASLMGIDAVNHDYPGYIGMIGSYGIRPANILLSHADLVIVLGSRLDLRQTGAMKTEFIKNGKIIHIDIDDAELGYNIKHTQVKINVDVNTFLDEMLLQTDSYPEYSHWHRQIAAIQRLLPQYPTEDLYEYIHPNYFFHRLSEIMESDIIYVNDVWQNQMWSSQSLKLKKWDRLLNCGWLGSMGFSLPSALWASFAPDVKRVISINGDGGFQMNMQELETISSRNLSIGIIVMNNKSLGMVREFQDTYFEGRNIGTVIGYSCPDLSLVAMTYRMPYFRIEKASDLDEVFSKIKPIPWPYILEVMISSKAIVEPKMLYGSTLDKQSPALPEDIEAQIQTIFSS